jgi:hypothetical protein
MQAGIADDSDLTLVLDSEAQRHVCSRASYSNVGV